jgi:Rrf2 family protein
VYVSARTIYAVRAALAIAADQAGVLTAARLADAQGMSYGYLQGILQDLRRAGLLIGHRGSDGGYALARPAEEISVGDVLRAINGSLTTVRGLPVRHPMNQVSAEGLDEVWLSVNRAIEEVVDAASLADLLIPRRTGST